MTNAIEVLFLRRPRIDYISPPICEAIFSSSSGPVIVLNPLTAQSFPTGLIFSGTGNFFLSWDNYPGALCYSVYKADTSDPFGSYTIVAECIPSPPFNIEPFGAGCYRVSAITANGETPLSLPVCSTVAPPILPHVITDPADNIMSDSARLNGFVSPNGNTTTVHFEWGLTAAYGNITGNQSVGVAETAFLAAISGLSASTTYHFRAVASSIAGTAFGADESFMTSAPPGPCPPGGTPTPCDLSIPGAGVLGNIVVTFAEGDFNLGPLPPGLYTLKYINGVFHTDDNPCPWNLTNLWKFVSLSVSTNGVPVVDWLDPVLSLCSASEANLADDVRAFRETYDFEALGETWGIHFGPVVFTNPVAGSPMPTWQLIQNSLYPDEPARVRIVGFNPAVFSVCVGQPASAQPAWNGTFPVLTSPSPFPVYDISAINNSFSINGQRLGSGEVNYDNGGSLPTPTGCGWVLNIFLGNTYLWLGYKGTGTTPEGCYVRDSGCSTGPASLTIESY